MRPPHNFRIHIALVACLSLTAAISAQPAWAQAEAVAEPQIPPARTTYMGRRIAPTMGYQHAGWLTRDTRQEEESPAEALEVLELKPGMTVCDMGCGNGFYTLLMADKVGPEGKVLAVDIQQEMLHLLDLRCKEVNVKNVVPVLGGIADPNLPKGKVDLVLMVDVYHEFSHPEQMLAGIRKSLSPKGVIALLEYREEDPLVPIRPLHKMSKKQILREYQNNGFKLARQYDQLPWQHLMFFESDPTWQPKTGSQATDR